MRGPVSIVTHSWESLISNFEYIDWEDSLADALVGGCYISSDSVIQMINEALVIYT